MDGFPRTIEQAEGFAEIVGAETLCGAIQIEVPTDVVLADPRSPGVPHVRDDNVGTARGRSHPVPAWRRMGGAPQGRHRDRDPSAPRAVRR